MDSKGEWCVEYHEVGKGQESAKIKDIIGAICGECFKHGSQPYHG